MIRRFSVVVVLMLASNRSFVGRQAPSTNVQPANAWMQTAAQTPADTSAPALRAARDRFFDAIFGTGIPLTPQSASWSHIARSPSANDDSKIPEMPAAINRSVIAGTFTQFASRLTNSQLAVYTEITVSVDRVFENSDGQLTNGSTITVAIPGGSVQSGQNQLSYLTDPEEFFIQPQKRYLWVLSYNASGQFYTLVKDWDLSSGAVQANSKLEQARVNHGHSTLVGVTADRLDAALAPLLAKTRGW